MMNDSGIRTFTAGEALAANRLVKLSAANTVVYADAGELAIGVTRTVAANGATVAVFLLGGKPGTIVVTAAGNITVNALVYPAADGEIDAVSAGQAVGVALNAGSDGALVEVLPLPATYGSRESVSTSTGTKTLTAGDARYQFIDAGGAVDVNLPAEADSKGLSFVIFNTDADAVSITVKDDGGGTVATVANGEGCLLVCNGTVWMGLVGANT